VTLACELPRAAVTATDVSSGALIVARDNAVRHHVADRIAVVEGPLFADQPGPWDLIVSNPPYVPRREYDGLAADVRDFEPRVALLGGDDGLDVIRAITRAAAGALAPGGSLVMEIGAGQVDAVRALIDQTAGLSWTRVLPDLQGIPRVVVATCCRR
jgi:release factor glutamine methyltransferase